jgi:adenosine deaminase
MNQESASATPRRENVSADSPHRMPASDPFAPSPRLKGKPTAELIHSLPKTDLHCHLDGSLRPETILEMAEEQKVSLPAADLDGLRKIVIPGEECQSLEDYLRAFDITLSVMQEYDAIARVAYELCEDFAKENVWYFEVRYSPILHTRNGLKLTQIVDAVLEGLEQGRREFGIESGLIICAMRNTSPNVSHQLAELCVAYKGRGVVAFDLAGAEENFPAKRHREAFFLIHKNDINCTIHAGEAYGPESISQALHYCGAHRIGHGTRLKDDGDLLNYINDHRIPLEVCPTSNVQTRTVNSMAEHPLRFYFDYGLRVTVNTDNRLVSDTTVSRELLLVAEAFNFNIDDVRQLIINGFKSAFIPYRRKVALLNRVTIEMSRLLSTHDEELQERL